MPRRDGQIAHHRALELAGALDLDLHHRLQQHRPASWGTSRASPSGRRSGTPCRNCRLRGTSRLRGTPARPTTGYRRSGPWRASSGSPFRRPGCTAWECARRRRSPRRRNVSSASSGSSVEPADDVGVLARAAGLLLVPDVELGGLRGRFAVVDLRRADFDLDLVLAADPLDVDLQVQLAHAGDDRLARLFVGARRAASGLRGGSGAGPCSAGRRRRGSSGAMAILMTGSGTNMLLQRAVVRAPRRRCRRWRSRRPARPRCRPPRPRRCLRAGRRASARCG